MTDYGEGIVQVPYDGVNGISLMNNDTGTDGSGGTTEGNVRYQYVISQTGSSGISGIGWGDWEKDPEDIFKLYTDSPAKFEEELESFIFSQLNHSLPEKRKEFFAEFVGCQVGIL